MKISIITVSFNSAKTIGDTLHSVSNQSQLPYEHIVIDGKSTDGTLQIIENSISDNLVLVSEPDNGIYDAMNKGIKIAKGEIIGILNSDDLYYDGNVLQNVLLIFQSNPNIKIVYGDLVYVNRHDTNKVVRYWKSKPYYDNFFEHANIPPHPSVFIKKALYDKIGIYNTNFKLAADYEFMLRAMKLENATSSYLPEILVRMRLGGATNKSFKNIIKGNKEIKKAWILNNLELPLSYWPNKLLDKIMQFFNH